MPHCLLWTLEIIHKYSGVDSCGHNASSTAFVIIFCHRNAFNRIHFQSSTTRRLRHTWKTQLVLCGTSVIKSSVVPSKGTINMILAAHPSWLYSSRLSRPSLGLNVSWASIYLLLYHSWPSYIPSISSLSLLCDMFRSLYGSRGHPCARICR